jgi:protein-L-isoaspartate(D-aspartate) O-methyltransferase
MVENQIASRGVRDPRVLAAMAKVPRHLFIPPALWDEAYADYPLPIGEGQTISQPYIVAFMTDALAIRPEDKVLEVGTGSGYQAAVLAELAADVYSVEIVDELAARATHTLQALGYGRVQVRQGDGFFGWPEAAPFDAVIITCATRSVPPPLLAQLKDGGRLILPLEHEDGYQVLTLVTKTGGKTSTRAILDVRFVPMTGEARKKD